MRYSSTCVNDWGHSLRAPKLGCDYIVLRARLSRVRVWLARLVTVSGVQGKYGAT